MHETPQPTRPGSDRPRLALIGLAFLTAGVAVGWLAATNRGTKSPLKTIDSPAAPASRDDRTEDEARPFGIVWKDRVKYRMPEDSVIKSRTERAATWLKAHLVPIISHDPECPLRVIAWKDPTLEPEKPNLLAGYVITDTLWSAKALTLFDPAAAREMESGLQCLGWYGNGLQDVLFHPLEKILHRPADADFVHGFSLGCFPAADGKTVDLRTFRQKWDADFQIGHPRLFAEHAVYEALFDYWQGRGDAARRRILGVIEDSRTTDVGDRIFWDRESGVLVDFGTYESWLAYHNGERPDCRHFTFKLGVLLYAIRVLGMQETCASYLAGMQQRLWSSQTESGGVSHFVDVHRDGTTTAGIGSTGEATSIAILAEVVEAE